MKRILLSLTTLGVIAGVALFVTNAFFSDTETSTGNTFQAGQIDLKIDHTRATYNGNECRNDCSNAGPNLLSNPGFESNPVTSPTGWDIFPNGLAAGWIVEWAPGQPTTYNSVTRPDPALLELHKDGTLANTGDIPDSWRPAEGTQYAELDSDWNGHVGSLNNEPALIRIYQDIPTVNGKTYKLSFYHSPRPGTSAGQNAMNISWNGGLLATVDPGAGGAATSWTPYSYEVTATSNLTRVQFEGGGAMDSLGVFVDNTGLAACSYIIEGGQCQLWPLKDLDPTDFFWKFNDVKPGDHGTNVISYHVYDNNAWMCTFLTKEDLENVIVDPEATAGDVTDPLGELSKYIEIFAWNDINNNGVYEPGSAETQMATGTLGSLNYFPIAQPTGTPVIASTTKYIGLAWCFGTQTVDSTTGAISCSGVGDQNDSQTDILNETVKFYAEQARNNPNFNCQSLSLQ